MVRPGFSAVALIVFTALGLLGIKDHAAQIGLTNDNLTALFHGHQVWELGLGHLPRINWARIPSLVPDYAIAAIADQLGPRLEEKVTLSCLLQAGLGIGSVALLPLACYGGLLLLSPDIRQHAFMASLPVNLFDDQP